MLCCHLLELLMAILVVILFDIQLGDQRPQRHVAVQSLVRNGADDFILEKVALAVGVKGPEGSPGEGLNIPHVPSHDLSC